MTARAALLASVVLVGCGSAAAPPRSSPTASPTPEVQELTGQLTLHDPDTVAAGCVGQGGYDDITEGADVVVKDQNGTVVATGSLQAGTAQGGDCVYPFRVAGVPKEAFYVVEVSHRGELHYSYAEMQGNGWTVAMTLGH